MQAGELGPIKNLINSIGEITAALIPILIGITLVVFFYGLIQYVMKSGEKGHEQGKKTMIAGLAALFIMVSVYGIIRLAQSAFGIDNNPNIQAPRIPNR